jgi:hypothetical protein
MGLKGNAYTYRVLVGTREKSDYLLELEMVGRIVLIWETVKWIFYLIIWKVAGSCEHCNGILVSTTRLGIFEYLKNE